MFEFESGRSNGLNLCISGWSGMGESKQKLPSNLSGKLGDSKKFWSAYWSVSTFGRRVPPTITNGVEVASILTDHANGVEVASILTDHANGVEVASILTDHANGVEVASILTDHANGVEVAFILTDHANLLNSHFFPV